MATTRQSGMAQGLSYAGGIAGIHALVIAFSAATGHRFQIGGDGGSSGIPLPQSWFHAALFVALGGALWLAGGRWDTPRFVAVRARRPWLMPVVTGLVLVPAGLVLLFLLVS